jgi:hypothetical protein
MVHKIKIYRSLIQVLPRNKVRMDKEVRWYDSTAHGAPLRLQGHPLQNRKEGILVVPMVVYKRSVLVPKLMLCVNTYLVPT